MEKKLVSIVVVTYNNENVILETLESIKNQTYKFIELIVSDDNSKDNTVNIVQSWIENNKNHFYNTNLVTSSKNTGITNNIKRGIIESKGEYIKIIGDDILMPNAIEILVNTYENCHGEKIVWVAKMEPFSKENIDLTSNYQFLKLCSNFLKLSSQKQKKILIKNCTISAPVAEFFHKDIIKNYGLFQEGIDHIEDWPCWLTLINNDFEFRELDYTLVRYRVTTQSLTQSTGLISHFSVAKMNIFFKIRYKLLLKNGCIFRFFKELTLNIYIKMLLLLNK